jgi:glycogen(starch) synthase
VFLESPSVSRRRVLLAGHYPPPFAGESIHVKQLAHLLREKGVEVEILNLRRGAGPSSEYRHTSRLLPFLSMPFRLPQRSTIFHLHTNGHNWKSWVLIFVAALAARLKGAPMILTIHSGLMPRYAKRLGKGRITIARWALRSFSRVVCVNAEIARTMKELGVDDGRIRVIPAFLGIAEPGEMATADELAIRRFQPLLVVVGGGDLDPELGLPVVAHALRELRETFPRVGAVFIGWMVGPKITPLIRNLGLTDHAICLGEVSHERCLALLRRGDVVVRSTFTDGDAITVREALALGVPVVASDTHFRPEGTILFRRGDSADLQSKLIDVLSRGTPAGLRRGTPARKSGCDRACPSADQLWGVYCEVGAIDRAS